MAKFQVGFFRAARKAGIGSDEAQLLTELTEEFIVTKIAEATQPVVARLDALSLQMTGQMDNLKGDIGNKVTMGRVQLVLVMAVAALGGAFGPMITKSIGLG